MYCGCLKFYHAQGPAEVCNNLDCSFLEAKSWTFIHYLKNI
jgi:hypothetical protein